MKQTTPLHKRLRKQMAKAIHDYQMIRPGERILVGLSGGGDSLSLFHLLWEHRRYIQPGFELMAAHVDLGFDTKEAREADASLASFVSSYDVPWHVVRTRIKDRALDPHAVKNPCFICSMYRRKQIYEIAHKQGCTRIAYGHHKDDIVETLLINILYGRKIEAMSPVQDVFKGSMQIIRPLAYIDESDLKRFAKQQEFPVYPVLCPADGNTRRQIVKDLIAGLQRREKNANIRQNIFRSLSYVHMDFDKYRRKG